MKTSDKIDAVSSALVDLQGEISNVKSSSTNPFFHSKYADLSTIIQTVRPLLATHHMAIIQGCDGDVLTTRLVHESGQWIETQLKLSVAKWTDPQKVGAAITYARRYEQAAILNIAQTDDDGNALAQDAAKLITTEQSVDLQALIEEVDADSDKMLEYFKVSKLSEMNADQYGKAVKMLEKKR